MVLALRSAHGAHGDCDVPCDSLRPFVGIHRRRSRRLTSQVKFNSVEPWCGNVAIHRLRFIPDRTCRFRWRDARQKVLAAVVFQPRRICASDVCDDQGGSATCACGVYPTWPPNGIFGREIYCGTSSHLRVTCSRVRVSCSESDCGVRGSMDHNDDTDNHFPVS